MKKRHCRGHAGSCGKLREAARIGGVRPLINLNSMYFNGSTGHWSMPDVPQGTVADIYIYIYIYIYTGVMYGTPGVIHVWYIRCGSCMVRDAAAGHPSHPAIQRRGARGLLMSDGAQVKAAPLHGWMAGMAGGGISYHT